MTGVSELTYSFNPVIDSFNFASPSALKPLANAGSPQQYQLINSVLYSNFSSNFIADFTSDELKKSPTQPEKTTAFLSSFLS